MAKINKSSVTVVKSSKQPIRKLSKTYSFNDRSIPKNNIKDNLGVFGSALSVVVGLLFIIAILRFFLVPEQPIITFSSLLEILQNAPEFVFKSGAINLTITADWGIFEFFKNFINLFTGSIEFLISVIELVMYSVDYILYYLKVFFAFSI